MSPPSPQAVVIGASAGALDALTQLLPTLPASFRLPILIVVHLPPDKKSIMADLFRAKCAVAVREAEDKEPIAPATVYFAPPDYHLMVEKDRRLSLSADETVLFSRPSIDVLFETAADAYGAALIGVVLTGGNSDGANGLRTIAAGGGTALVQTPDTAYATAMPTAALDTCSTALALSLPQIAAYLQKAGSP